MYSLAMIEYQKRPGGLDLWALAGFGDEKLQAVPNLPAP